MEYLYRYTEEMRCGFNLTEGDEDFYTTGPHLRLDKYQIKKRTPCGAWIAMGCTEDRKFVNLQATKRFACETEEEALVSFMERKRKQIRILKEQIRQAEMALGIAEREHQDQQRRSRPTTSGGDNEVKYSNHTIQAAIDQCSLHDGRWHIGTPEWGGAR